MVRHKIIPLTQGKVALVDVADFEELSQYKWRAQRDSKTGNFYALRSVGRHVISMHRQLLDPDPGMYGDHKNRDGLDNRRNNLRQCTKSQNHHNQKPRVDRQTSFKGVSQYNDRTNLWRARIVVEGKRIHLGCFKSAEQAARAYDDAATRYFGQFARVNFGEAETAGGNW